MNTIKNSSGVYDLLCIGAGPTGLASAIEGKRSGMRVLVVDKGCLCNSLYHYPVNMVFFTTPELLEIGDLPLYNEDLERLRAALPTDAAVACVAPGVWLAGSGCMLSWMW